MSTAVEVVSLGILSYIVDAVVWGAGGYVIARKIVWPALSWKLTAGLTCVVKLGYDLVTARLVSLLDLRIGNPEVADLLGTTRAWVVGGVDPLLDGFIVWFTVGSVFRGLVFLLEERDASGTIAAATDRTE